MKIIGFSFNKINVEKFKDKFDGLKIDTNIDIPEIKEIKSGPLKLKEDLLGIDFSFVVDYQPDIAKITLNGKIIVAVDSKVVKEVLKQWKNKKMPEDFRLRLFNIILRKSSIKAIQLEDEMNLPPHIPMPSLKKQE